MYKLFLILRYLRKRRIAICAIVSVWLCVAMVLIVISVMGGFLDMVKERSRGLLSDLIVDNRSLRGFPYYEEFIRELREKMPDQVALATPVIYNYGVLRIKDTAFTKPVRIVGINLAEYAGVNDFGGGLFYQKFYPNTTTLEPQRQPLMGFNDEGLARLPKEYEDAWQRWLTGHPGQAPPGTPNLRTGEGVRGPGLFQTTYGEPGYADEADEPSPGIIVGYDLINERREDASDSRQLPKGVGVLLTFLPMSATGDVKTENAIVKQFRLADDSRTGVYEIDSLCVYVDFKLVQSLLRMEAREREDGTPVAPRTSQVLIKLKPGQEAGSVKKEVLALWRELASRLPVEPGSSDSLLLADVAVETWEERQAPFIAAVEKEKVLVTILFSLISLVAIVLIACIFYMIVEKKTRDIGIIKSVGASAGGVAGIFIGYGAAVGVIGSALGTITGVVFVRYINEIQSWLASLNPQLRVWSPAVYTFDRIPNIVKGDEAAVIVVVAIVASILGALLPAVIAARVWPVNALRYE